MISLWHVAPLLCLGYTRNCPSKPTELVSFGRCLPTIGRESQKSTMNPQSAGRADSYLRIPMSPEVRMYEGSIRLLACSRNARRLVTSELI